MSTAISEIYDEIMPEVPGCPFPIVNKAIINTVRDLCAFSKIWTERLTPITTVAIELATDIAFVSGSPCTITSTSSSFVTAGFAQYDEIVTDQQTDDEDYKDNTGPYTLATVAANALTLASTDSLASEAAGDSTNIAKCAYALSSSNGDIVEALEVNFDGSPVRMKTEAWLKARFPNWRFDMSSSPEYCTVDMQSKLIRLVPVVNEVIADALEVRVALKPSTGSLTIEDFLYNEYKSTIAFGALARLQKGKIQPWHDMQAAMMNIELYNQGRDQAKRHGYQGLTSAWQDMEA